MTRLLDLNDYAIGLPAIGPNVDAAYADERRWDDAADRAADLMQDAEAIAQYADDGGRDVSLPAELADLIRLANAIPAANLTVRQIAALTGLPKSTLHDHLAGRRRRGGAGG